MSAIILGAVIIFAIWFIPMVLGNGDWGVGIQVLVFVALVLGVTWLIGTVAMWLFSLLGLM